MDSAFVDKYGISGSNNVKYALWKRKRLQLQQKLDYLPVVATTQIMTQTLITM
jgi:hypothetical protein